MKKRITNTLIGTVAAIIVFGLIIYAIEEKKSALQIITGFIIFIIPFSFISSFTSKIASFILVSVAILFGYLVYKEGYHDVWIGIVQALVIGGSIYYFRIRTTNTFLASNYKEKAKKQKKENAR